MKQFRLAQQVVYTEPGTNVTIKGKVVGQGWHVRPYTPSPGYIPMVPHVIIELDQGFYHLDEDKRPLGYVSMLVVHPDHVEGT